jgi:uncharacterized protein with NRDE domain
VPVKNCTAAKICREGYDMCLILFAYETHPRYRLVLAANRDEFFDRPTAALDQWQDHPHVVAGRDLKEMGTWMGINRRGYLAAITNYRDPAVIQPRAPSRGHLVADYLTGDIPARSYLEHVEARGRRYNGFNLLVGDTRGLYYLSNRDQTGVRRIAPGYYGLSNHLLNTPWPKVESGVRALAAVLEKDIHPDIESMLDLLMNQTPAADDRLPDTGVSRAWEKILSSVFIRSSNYGTRSSSLLLVDDQGGMTFIERTWENGSGAPKERETRKFEVSATGTGC